MTQNERSEKNSFSEEVNFNNQTLGSVKSSMKSDERLGVGRNNE